MACVSPVSLLEDGLEEVKKTYQQSYSRASVLLGRLAALPTLLPLAVLLGDLVLTSAGFEAFDRRSSGHGGGGCEEEDFGELHVCLWGEGLVLDCGCCRCLGLRRWRCELMRAKMRRTVSIIYPDLRTWRSIMSYTSS